MGVFATANSPSGIHSKSTDKLKSMMSFRERAADDREEGEIIDEYEDIISSDEEFSMRQRIEELEAKNAELEKIANISAIYASGNYDYAKKDSSSHHVDRYPLISIDISDEEDYPPPPSMTRITKRRKSLEHSSSRRKILHTTSNSGHRRRKKSSSPPPAPPYRQSDKMLLSMFHEKYAVRSSSKKRRKNKKSHRKVREYQYLSDDYTLDNYNLDAIDGYENYNSSDADGNFSINRDELRLALARNTHRHEQHVSLKDRLIRRKENTDTLNEKSVGNNQEIAEVEDNSDGPQDKADAEAEDNMEEQELRIIALKSAVIRKHMVRKKRNENVAYSPSDFDEAYANISASPSINIDDAEPCMEISPVPSPKIVISDDDGIDTKPVDMDIVHSDSECELSYEKWVPIEQIPLPNMMMQDELYVPTPLRYNTNVDHQHYMPPDVRYESALDSPANLDSDVEEEELALRALLLAKMNSPKVNKHVIEERPKIEERHSLDADTSLEAEALRDFLISNMKKKTQQPNSSASVLKEAVRRLTARNTNCSPLESFVELSSIQGRCESVSAFSMTLRDAENQLSQSTADLAKIQIGQPGIKANNVGQGWTLWDTDEGYSEVKFHLSPKKIKVEPNEESCVVNSNFERLAKGVKREGVDQMALKSPKHELEAESKKADGAENEERDKESGSLAKVVSAKDSKSPEDEEDGRQPSVVHVSASKNENQADVEVNAKEHTVEEEKIEQDSTVEREETSVPEVKENDTEIPKTTSSVLSFCGESLLQDNSTETTDQAEKNVAEVEKDTQSRPKTTPVPPSTDRDLMKDITPEPAVHPEKNMAEVKKDTQNTAMVKSSSATSSVVKVTTTEINESATPPVSDTNVKTCVTTVDPKAVKSLDVVGQASIDPAEINSAPVPTQKMVTIATKKNPVPSGSKVAKSLATSQNSVPQQKKVASSAPPEVKKESSSSVAKGGRENTNSMAVKQEKQITEQLFTSKPLPLAQSAQKPHPKPSVQQSTKIVNPNKVINTRVTDLKRPPSEKIAVPAKIAKLDDSSNRLITAAEMPQVKKLVIQLRASDTESDYSALSADGDDDDDDLDARDRDFINRSITTGNEYYDIASPISLPMESPCETPTRTASPIASVTPQPIVQKCIENDFFQAQLDKFLKNVRSKVAESSKQPVDVEESAPPAVSTPVAVRHLPEASQQEYRRLINRMKMLERQKRAKNLQVIVKNTNALTSAEARTVMGDGESLVRKVLVKNASVNTAKPTCQVKIPQKQVSKTLLVVGKTVPSTPPQGAQKPTTPEKEGKAISAVVLPRKVPPSLAPSTSDPALPAASPPKTTSVSEKSIPPSTTKPGPPTTPKQSNQKLLVLYEKTYRETGNSIISNLDRSIEMVTVAKKAKMEKLKYEHRLMELRKEMEDVQRHIRQHQERITKIYPEICNSHRMIETLKTRRVKIQKDVTVFGKRVIGQSYSMNNDQKPIISEKSKKLAAEIKLVNNMKLSDVEKWQSLTQPSRTDTAAIVVAPVKVPVVENDSLICPSHDTVTVDDSKMNPIETSLPEATSRIEPELTHTVVPERILNEPKKGVDQTDQDQTNSTNGHEEALEIERPVGDDKQAHNSRDDEEEEEEEKVNRGDEDERVENREVFKNEQMGGTKLQDYVSPLGHLRDERQINPNGIVCPYQLMGQCGDKDCKYMHLDN